MAAAPSTGPSSALRHWRHPVVRAVDASTERHSIHGYFTGCPESPDGQWVLFFTSRRENGHHGEVRVLHRLNGRAIVLLNEVEVEDAHRVACQQWAGQDHVVCHARQNGRWHVFAGEATSGPLLALAVDRQVGWSQPQSRYVPLNGLHWDPEGHCDLELLDLADGRLHTAVTAAQVRRQYPEWVEREFGCGPISLYFPILSPDGRRVIFKVAAPRGGHWQSATASHREGLLAYDLERQRFLHRWDQWGHPCWHPDSRHVVNVPGVLHDTETGLTRAFPQVPTFMNAHPTLSPTGDLCLTDTILEPWQRGQRAIVMGDWQSGHWEQIHTFDHSGGATSWRPSHPHPAFNAAGTRLYFNAAAGPWTRLYSLEPAQHAYSS